MQRIWTTLVGYFDVPLLGASLLALGACGLPGCVFNASGNGTTDVALDTGDLTTEVSAAESSTGEPDPGGTQADDDGSTTAVDETGSDSDEPADPDTTTTTTSDSGNDPCGNGAIDGDEECDGELVPESCAEIDAAYTAGAPTCDDACKLDISACVTCQAPKLKPCDDMSDEPLHALELGCDTVDGWDPTNSVHLNSKTLASLDSTAYRVVRRFGSDPDAWTPHAGSKALLIGTGNFEPADMNGVVTDKAGDAQYGGGNLNPDSKGSLPNELRVHTAKGGMSPFIECDGENDCSNTLSDQWNALSPKEAYDVAWLEVETVVPPGTHGFALDLAFFTAHYPEYNFSGYNDMAVVWIDSEAYVGNISYRQHGDMNSKYSPLSLPGLVGAGWMIHDGSKDPALAGTGYDADPNKFGSQGGASAWMTVEGPAVPGESLILTLAIMDLEDSSIDSALLVDNFRWSCLACDLAQTCGLRLADKL